MAGLAFQATAKTALTLLAGNTATADDYGSEDELHADTEPQWEWIYASANLDDTGRDSEGDTQQSSLGARDIIGARLGKFEIYVGDTVTLKADRNDVWVAIISKFLDGDDTSSDADILGLDSTDDDEDGDADIKRALFTWLSSPREIRNPRHRRTDCLPNELYATSNSDVNPLEAIIGRAIILSPTHFRDRFPDGRFPKGHPDANRVFVCRRGANLRTITYTEDFEWGVDVMQGHDRDQEVQNLVDKVEQETVATRKRKRTGQDTVEGLKEFVVDDSDNDATPRTPRKRRKATDGETTPRKRGSGSGTTPKRTPASKFTTPTHKRIVEKKALMFTPLGTRVLSPGQGAYLSSPHAQARTNLHVANVPLSLPCREDEFSTVFTHLEAAISDGTGACIYISGTPGTGKTATVREVVAQLKASEQADELDEFVFVEINGMRVTDPHESYSILWEKLTGARVAPSHALTLLGQEFGRPSPRRVPVVVLMDELDQLATRSQGVMYNFFQWPQLRHSRLIVLAVANTMDLPERTLSNKISSRLGLTRIVFQGYTHPQLMKIVETRLENIPSRDVMVDKDAIQFAARKVAGVSGDARRCLDICRRAVELAEEEASEAAVADAPATPSKRGRGGKDFAAIDVNRKGRVTIATVQRAIRESTTSPIQLYIKTIPLAAKLLLAAMLTMMRRTGVAEGMLGDVLDEAKRMGTMSEVPAISEWLMGEAVVESETGDSCKRKGMGRLGEADVMVRKAVPRVLGLNSAVAELVDAGVIVTEEQRGERAARCRILVSEEDVKGALAGDDEVRGLGFTS